MGKSKGKERVITTLVEKLGACPGLAVDGKKRLDRVPMEKASWWISARGVDPNEKQGISPFTFSVAGSRP